MTLSTLYPDQSTLVLGQIDHFVEKEDLFLPFALDDASLHLLNQVETTYDAILHFWPTAPAVFLGGMDMRTPFIDQGLKFLIDKAQLPTIIRPAGGLAVVSDPGILNFTLVLNTGDQRLPIDQAYQVMVDLMNEVLAPYDLVGKTGQVDDSYCPGAYDFSVNGKKIAGIAQRRIGQAVGIYVYVSLKGPQDQRGQLIRDFYTQAIQGQETRTFYPQINPDSMANLGDFCPDLASGSAFKQALIKAVKASGFSSEPLDWEQLAIEKHLEKMHKRNQKIVEMTSLADKE